MGRIVGSFCFSHVMFSPREVEEQAQRVVEGLAEIGRRVTNLQPDAIIVVSSGHPMNHHFAFQPPIMVCMNDEYEALGEMDIPRIPIRGHRSLATAVVRQASAHGLDLTRAEEYKLDHGVMVPLIFTQQTKTPVVAVINNFAIDPLVPPERLLALGDAINVAVEQDLEPAARVVVYGLGGLSHWLGMEEMGRINAEWDRRLLDLCASGRGEELAALTPDEVVRDGGNGGLEVYNWLVAARAAPKRRGEVLFYEPVAPWLTGIGGVALDAEAGLVAQALPAAA